MATFTQRSVFRALKMSPPPGWKAAPNLQLPRTLFYKHVHIGRLLYGFIMDKTSYKVAMTIESTLLMLLVSTFYLTSIIGNNHVVERSWNYLVNIDGFISK